MASNIKIDDNTVATLLPPFMGAVVAVLRNQKKKPSNTQVVIQVFTGFVTAYYLTPIFADILNIETRGRHWYSAIGFVVGLAGYSVLPFLADLTGLTIKAIFERYTNEKKD